MITLDSSITTAVNMDALTWLLVTFRDALAFSVGAGVVVRLLWKSLRSP